MPGGVICPQINLSSTEALKCSAMVLSIATGTACASTSGGHAGGVRPVTSEMLNVAVVSMDVPLRGDTAVGIASDCASGCAAASITGVDTVDICSSCGWPIVRLKLNVLSGIHQGVLMWTSQVTRRYAGFGP